MPDHSTILKTKLYRPPIMDDSVLRTDVLDSLNKHIDLPITLVSAPAGYGKSICVSQWLESMQHPNCWISLDSEHNDLSNFLEYIVEGINIKLPGTIEKTKGYLSAATLPPESVIAAELINELDKIEGDFIIVLDDYHRIKSNSIHELLSTLIKYPPQNCHLVIITRTDPPLKINQLRAYGRINEVRMAELRFGADEAEQLCEKMLLSDFGRDATEDLVNKTEGWIVGLRLAYLYISNAQDQNIALEKISGTTSLISDFLVEEVISNLPDELRSLILRSSILDRFCGELCNHLQPEIENPKIEGEDFINQLNNINLFVIPLDVERTWFRFHHLFRDLLFMLLEKELEQDEIIKLQLAASQWFEDQNLPTEAIHHALQANSIDRVTKIVEKFRIPFLNIDRWRDFWQWLEMIPEEYFNQRAELMMVKVWVRYIQFDYPALFNHLQQVQKTLGENNPEHLIWGEVHFFNGYFVFWQGMINDTLQLNQLAKSRFDQKFDRLAGELQLQYAICQHMIGETEKGLSYLEDTLATEKTLAPIHEIRVVAGFAYINVLCGDLGKALIGAKNLSELGSKYEDAFARTWGDYLLGLIYSYQFDYEKADDVLSPLLDNPYEVNPRVLTDVYACLIIVYQLTNQKQKMQHALEQFDRFIQQVDNPMYSILNKSFTSRLLLLIGRTSEAMELSISFDFTIDQTLIVWWLETSRVTKCKIQIEEGSKKNLEEALEKINLMIQEAEATYNVCYQIQLLLLRAKSLHKLGNTSEAQHSLISALELGEKGSWVLPFVEAGDEVMEMLHQLSDSGKGSHYIDRIISLKNHVVAQVGVKNQIPLISVSNVSSTTGIQLSIRELEVAGLVVEGYRNKEIGQKLFVSEVTIKKHLYNIFKKLDVNNRIHMVQKAKENGIIN